MKYLKKNSFQKFSPETFFSIFFSNLSPGPILTILTNLLRGISFFTLMSHNSFYEKCHTGNKNACCENRIRTLFL